MGGLGLFRKVRRWFCLMSPAQGGGTQQPIGQGECNVCQVPALQEEQVGQDPSQAMVLMVYLCQPPSSPPSPST